MRVFTMELYTELLILGLIIFANGVFAMAELALVSARKARLRKLAEGGNANAKVALELANAPTHFLSTVQFGVTLSGIVAGVYGGAVLASQLAAKLAQFPPLAAYSQLLSVALVVTGITYVSIVVGELLPKRVALTAPERVATILARPMRLVARMAAPFIWVLTASTEGLSRCLRIKDPKEAPVTQEEVSTLIEEGLHAGVFQKAERDMVEGVLGLDQLPVTSLMTMRPKIVWLNIDDSDEVNWRKIVASGHSHFPVYHETRDQVLGMVAVKALWAHSAIGLPTPLKNLLTPPLIVPETMMAMQLLEAFKKTSKHIALVADEFGSVQGMVTLIDVLEAIVGDLPDQMRRARPEAKQREDGSWLIDATLSTGELKELLMLRQLPQENEADFQTLGGFVVTQLGRIPAAGDHFDWEGWRFEVVDMDRHRVDKVLVFRLPVPAPSPKNAS
ncbi:MAG: hemolysin family protein [Opitutaceae bacterium]|nr:hemolysin family protein [Opitutaceae bacterium]